MLIQQSKFQYSLVVPLYYTLKIVFLILDDEGHLGGGRWRGGVKKEGGKGGWGGGGGCKNYIGQVEAHFFELQHPPPPPPPLSAAKWSGLLSGI